MAFLYTNNKLKERETKENNPIYYWNNNNENKIPRTKFNQAGKRLVLEKL